MAATKKSSIVDIWDGSEYTSVAVSFSCFINEITFRLAAVKTCSKIFQQFLFRITADLWYPATLTKTNYFENTFTYKTRCFCNTFSASLQFAEIWLKYKKLCCSVSMNFQCSYHFFMRSFLALSHNQVFCWFQKKNHLNAVEPWLIDLFLKIDNFDWLFENSDSWQALIYKYSTLKWLLRNIRYIQKIIKQFASNCFAYKPFDSYLLFRY